MSPRASKSVTLLELLISIVLIGLVILGLSNIESFCRNQLLTSDRRLKVQNEASFVLDHMAKHIGKAIGDAQNYPVDFNANPGSIIIDRNNNGVRDIINPDNEERYRIAYEYNQAAHTVSYCSSYDTNSNQCRSLAGPVIWEILASHIKNPPDIDTHGDETNYISVNITACWDPTRACGTINNPETTLRSRIIMPSVSIR